MFDLGLNSVTPWKTHPTLYEFDFQCGCKLHFNAKGHPSYVCKQTMCTDDFRWLLSQVR